MKRGKRLSLVLRRSILQGLLAWSLSSCAVVPQTHTPRVPTERPPELSQYYAYNKPADFNSAVIKTIREEEFYVHSLLSFETEYGPVEIDYYRRKTPSKSLIFVFPVLGGENIVERYFASFFAKNGFDAAIVHRDKDFKKPENFLALEELFRRNVIRDRIAIDYFSEVWGKSLFATFGISRGAMNAAVTAGVDARLEYNVLALGGSHIVDVFRLSDVGGVKKYKKRVMESLGISEEEFYAHLRRTVRSDPARVGKFLNPKHTLLFLSMFDKAVPLRFGLKLRREIGYPRTSFLFAGHYSAILYTQFVKLLPPWDFISIFPPAYVETEALRFYNENFKAERFIPSALPFVAFTAPFELLGHAYFFLSDNTLGPQFTGSKPE